MIDHHARLKDINSPKIKRSKYSEGVAAKKHKDTSVKKMFVLAKIPSIDENHENMSQMISNLDMSGVDELSETVDGKMLLILSGKQSGRPKHDCGFCDVNFNNYETGGSLYTLGKLRKHHEVNIFAMITSSVLKKYYLGARSLHS